MLILRRNDCDGIKRLEEGGIWGEKNLSELMNMASIGDIFYSTWGYDQTNADFFQVVAVKNKTIMVRHIKKEVNDPKDGTMTGNAIPIKNAFDGAPKTKKLSARYDGQESFDAGNSMGSARKWNGNPIAISWYG